MMSLPQAALPHKHRVVGFLIRIAGAALQPTGEITEHAEEYSTAQEELAEATDAAACSPEASEPAHSGRFWPS